MNPSESFTGLDSIPTRQTRVGSVATPSYNPSAAGYYTYTTSTPPSSRGRKTSYAPGDNGSATMHLPVSTLSLHSWMFITCMCSHVNFIAYWSITATWITMETKALSDNEDIYGLSKIPPKEIGWSSGVTHGNHTLRQYTYSYF